jgi:hypothetical protein
MHRDTRLSRRSSQRFNVAAVIVVVDEDRLAVTAAMNDEVQFAGKNGAREASQGKAFVDATADAAAATLHHHLVDAARIKARLSSSPRPWARTRANAPTRR